MTKHFDPTTYHNPTLLKTPFKQLLDTYQRILQANRSDHDVAKSEKAVLRYLRRNAVTLEGVQMLVPEFNVRPWTLMDNLATNIGFYHSRGQISEPVLEDIYIWL